MPLALRDQYFVYIGGAPFGLAEEVSACGLAALSFPLAFRARHDKWKHALGRHIGRVVAHPRCAGVWVAFPCHSFSRTPARNAPRREREALDFLCRILQASAQEGKSAALENPLGSRIWAQPCVSRPEGLSFSRFDFCMFGTPWRKATKVLHANALGLTDAARCCAGAGGRCERSGKFHFALRGRDARSEFYASRSAEYPAPLARIWASELRAQAVARFTNPPHPPLRALVKVGVG